MPSQVQVQKVKQQKHKIQQQGSDSLQPLELSDALDEQELQDPNEAVSQQGATVASDIEAYAQKLSYDDAMGALVGDDGVADVGQLLQIIGQSAEFQAFLQKHHPDVMQRIGKQLQSPKFWASMVPVVNLGLLVKGAVSAQHKKNAAQNMKSGNEVTDAMMDVQSSHQKQKRNVAITQAMVNVGTTAMGGMGATLGALATPMLGVSGAMAQAAVTSSINTPLNSGLNQGLSKATEVFSADDLSDADQELGDGNLADYKTNRALLHYLGYAPRTTPEEMAAYGLEPEQEAARVLLKRQMGFDENEELIGRQQRVKGSVLGKEQKDWLTEEERGWYDKLKTDEATMDDVPEDMRLAMAWKQAKVFEMEDEVQKGRLKQAQKLPDPPQHAPSSQDADAPMSLEDMKGVLKVHQDLPDPPQQEDSSLNAKSDELTKLQQLDSLPEPPANLEDLKKLLKVHNDLPDPPQASDDSLSAVSQEMVLKSKLDQI